MQPVRLDHVIIGVADLSAASTSLTALLGREPSWRGRHPSYGTANVLYRLESSYLELLAPDPDATTTTAWTGSLGRFLNDRGDGLFSVALQTDDIQAAVATVRERGLPIEDPAEGSGQDLTTGAVRKWTNARIPPESTRGTRCFIIQHLSPADALPMASTPGRQETAVLDVAAVGIDSAEPDGARRMWREVFGLAERGIEGEPGVYSYDLGNATLKLRPGEARGDTPDSWSLLVLRVYSLNDLIERLVQSKLAYEHSTSFGLRGVTVEACGARFLLTDAAS